MHQLQVFTKRICQSILDTKLHIYTTCIFAHLSFQTHDPTQPTKNTNFRPIPEPTQLNPTQPAGQPNPWTTLLHMDVQPSTKSCQLQEGGEGAKQPREKGSAHGSSWVSAPIPRVVGFIAGWHWQMWVPISFYCSKYTNFGSLILRNIIEIVATRCHVSWLQSSEFDFGCVAAPHTAGGAYSAAQIP